MKSRNRPAWLALAAMALALSASPSRAALAGEDIERSVARVAALSPADRDVPHVARAFGLSPDRFHEFPAEALIHFGGFAFGIDDDPVTWGALERGPDGRTPMAFQFSFYRNMIRRGEGPPPVCVDMLALARDVRSFGWERAETRHGTGPYPTLVEMTFLRGPVDHRERLRTTHHRPVGEDEAPGCLESFEILP
jgi:hypothetical protein